MSWTKQEIIEQAYGELALHSFVVNLTPDILAQALRSLDAMMAMWNGKGIRLGYPLPSSADGSNLDDDSGLPDSAIEPVFMNLAMRRAGSHGKQVAQTTAAAAKEGYDMLMARAAMPPQVPYPTSMPAGAGNRPWVLDQSPFLPQPAEPINAGPDGELEFN